MNTNAGDANNLLDALIEKMRLKNDAALSRRLAVTPPVISKLRHRRIPVGASLLIRMHEESGLSIKELRLLMVEQRQKDEPTQCIPTGRVTRPLPQQFEAKKSKQYKTLPTWAEGLEIQIAKVLVWKGFKSKEEVLAALKRGERIDRIGTTRLVRLRGWLDAS